MKKILLTALILSLLTVTPNIIKAQENEERIMQEDKTDDHEENNSETEMENEAEVDMETNRENEISNENSLMMQNQGKEDQLQVATQQMQQLMDMENIGEEVGQKLQTIAKEQIQAQSQIQSQLEKIESKSRLMKSLFGPDYKAIQNIKTQIDQNRVRIENLTQLKQEVANETEESELQEAIQALIEQNTSLEEQIHAEEQIKSVFGWLIKLFSR